MEITFKTLTSKEAKLEVENTQVLNKVVIKICYDGDTFVEEQHFKVSGNRKAADYIKKESILDLGSKETRVSVKTTYGKTIVFEIESSCDMNNVKVITHANDESTFELLVLLCSAEHEPEREFESSVEEDYIFP